MKKKIFIAPLFLIFLLLACRKENNNTPVQVFGFTTLQAAREHLGKYADLFLTVEGSAYVSSTQYYGSEQKEWEIFARYNAEQLSERSDGGTFFINQNKLVYDKILGTYILLPNNDLSSIELDKLLKKDFGNDNVLKIIKNKDTIFQTQTYVPHEIAATNLNKYEKVAGSDFIKISRKEVNLQWNKDSRNTNGVVVFLSWSGDNMSKPINEQGTGGQKQVAVKLDDNGNATLPTTFFDGVPINAAFTISMIRGNIEVATGKDSRKYKFYATSWYKIQCTLID
ncbi:MAG: hypothetical protein RL329_3587 [Bacteroidota bacterium]|jgi:hypothetical protein